MASLFGGDAIQSDSAQHERYLQVVFRLMRRLETLFPFSFVNHRGAENTEFFCFY